jgi:LEA14-like dessication related protein
MKRRYSTGLALVLLTLATACAGFRAPEIELESVELGSIGITGGTMLVNVAVTNPNSFGARADELRYELFVREPGDASEDGWRRLAAGTYEEELVVRAGERRVVQVPVAFRFSDLGTAGVSALRTGRVDYRATGTARVRAAGVSRDVPFRKTGSVMIVGAR